MPPRRAWGRRSSLLPEVVCILKITPSVSAGIHWALAAYPRLVALLVLLSFASAAFAQSAARQAEMQFDIPAQPLDSALEAYMQVTGLQVLYKSTLTAGQSSLEVKGRFAPPQALIRLLTGTGLVARYTTESAFTVVSATSSPDDVSDTRQFADYDLYLGNAQNRIVAALCKNAVTRPGDYRVAVQFSIGQSGLIDDASLLDTTGDRMRDQNIVGVLRGLPVGRAPPTNMPQPVTMLVMPRTPGSPNECQRFAK